VKSSLFLKRGVDDRGNFPMLRLPSRNTPGDRNVLSPASAAETFRQVADRKLKKKFKTLLTPTLIFGYNDGPDFRSATQNATHSIVLLNVGK